MPHVKYRDTISSTYMEVLGFCLAWILHYTYKQKCQEDVEEQLTLSVCGTHRFV